MQSGSRRGFGVSVQSRTVTPKALSNSSPGLLQPWDQVNQRKLTLKAFANGWPGDGDKLLPRTEFLIFSRLARTPERIVTAEDLWQYAWGNEKPLNPESLHVFMYRLRGKLAPYSLQIETMINVGYRLIPK